MTDNVIDYPLVTEKAMDQMDFENKLQFIVHIDASKPEIRDAFETQYDVEVADVNTQITMKGQKKATIKLGEDDEAEDVAARIGVF